VKKFRVGTRSSNLALAQTRIFSKTFASLDSDIKILEVSITTHGDLSKEPLSHSVTPGLFVSALRDALLNREVDLIVHSMKDLPAKPFPGIVTGCIPTREDSRDCLFSTNGQTLSQLSPGSLIGTSSPRRAATIRRIRPDLRIESIRGNIETRISKVLTGEYDATLLAVAGLKRINRADVATEIYDNQYFVPAPGQGAISVECRESDTDLISQLHLLNDPMIELTTTAERAVLVGLNAGCTSAVGAIASYLDGILYLTAELANVENGLSKKVELSRTLNSTDTQIAYQMGLDAAGLLTSTDSVIRT
jgi:hydroxymethylbilane synthase